MISNAQLKAWKDEKYWDGGSSNPTTKAILCAELLERRQRDRWIPVSERLPEPGAWVLAVFHCGTLGVAQYVPFCDCSCKWHASGGTAPTHWRPLPEKP